MKLLAILLFLATPASATDWFVRQSCANNGNGTASSCATTIGGPGAWRGFSNVAWASIRPGDRLNLVSGETYVAPLNVGASGTAGSPITITVSGGGTAIIDAANGSLGINVSGRSYVTVDGVMGQAATGDTNYGLRVINISTANGAFCGYENNGGRRIRFLHIDCSGSTQSAPDDTRGGFFLTGQFFETGFTWVHSAIPPATIVSIATSGATATVTTQSPHGFAVGNLITIKKTSIKGYNGFSFRVTAVPNATSFQYAVPTSGLGVSSGGLAIFHWYASGMKTFSATGSTNFDDNILHDNLVENLYHDGILCGANCSAYNNVVKHVEESGHSDSLLVQSGSYSAVYNNYVEDSGDQNIYLDNIYDSVCGHLRIYNNILNSDPGLGIVIDPEGGAGTAPAAQGCTGSGASKWDDVVIANNTIFTTSASSIRQVARGQITNLVILNNILGPVTDNSFRNVEMSASTTFASLSSWDYNAYSPSSVNFPIVASYGANLTLTQLRTSLSPARETRGLTGNPSYVNPAAANFHLAGTDTIAIGKGLNLTTTYPFLVTDKRGNTRPAVGSWDLGAFQFVRPQPPITLRTP